MSGFCASDLDAWLALPEAERSRINREEAIRIRASIDAEQRAIEWHRKYLEALCEIQRLTRQLEGAYEAGYQRAIKMVAEGE